MKDGDQPMRTVATPLQVRIVALCALVAILDGFDTQAIAYVAPSISEQWGISSAAFGPVFGAGLFGLMIGALVFGPAADRFGPRRILLGAVAIFGVFALLTAWADSVEELLILRLLTGIGLGGAMPIIIALTNEYAPAQAKASTVTIMFCGFPLGSVLGGLAAVPLLDAFGWEAVFIVGGIMPLLLLPMLAVLIPESARFLAVHGERARIAPILARTAYTGTLDQFVATTRAENRTAGEGLPVTGLFIDGRATLTILLWTAFFMNLLVMYLLINWMPSLLRLQGLSLSTAILSTTLFNLGGVIGGLALGRLIDRGNPFVILGCAYLAASVFVLVIGMSSGSVPLLLGAAVASGAGISGAQAGLNAVTAAAYPPAVRSTGIGWALGVGRIGSIIGPVLGGALLQFGWSPSALVLFAVVPAACAALAVLSLRGRPSPLSAARPSTGNRAPTP